MVSSSNNPVNNKVGATISGVTNTFTVTNPSNTASSAARETITVGGGSAADPTLNWNVSGVTNWEMGADNSVNDNLTISQSTALGTNDVWRMDTSGRRTMPLQPSFLVYVDADIVDVTGDGTTYQLLFDTISFDQGSNITLNSGGSTIFTAPITGKYFFQLCLNPGKAISGSMNDGRGGVTKSGIIWDIFSCNPSSVRSGTNFGLIQNGSVILNCTAGDTVGASIFISGGTKTVDMVGRAGGPGNEQITYFSGFLMC